VRREQLAGRRSRAATHRGEAGTRPLGAAEGARASHRPVAAVGVDRRRSLSVESAQAELILAGAGHPSTDQAALSTTPFCRRYAAQPMVSAAKAVSTPFGALGGYSAIALDTVVLIPRRPFAWREFLLQSWFVALPGAK
jgi:hypothetical protein